MAGCNCDKEIYKIAYDDLTETVKSQHNDWSPTEVRLEVARTFRPQYRQHVESVKQEVSGKEQYDSTPFTFDKMNGVRFKNGDGTMGLLEFHERQARLTPEKYSPEEHAISLLIDTSIRSGANEVVTSYPSPDGHRDIVVMTLDRDTGKGIMRIINTQADRDASEIRSISKKAFSHLSENSSGDIFVLSDRPLPEKVVHQTLETIRYAGKQTVKEVRQTIKSVRQYIEHRKELGVQKQRQEHTEATPPVSKKQHVVERLIEKTLPLKKSKNVTVKKEVGLQRMTRKPLPDHGSLPVVVFASEKKSKRILVVPEMKKSIGRHERKVRKIKVQKEARMNVAPKKELRVRKKKEKIRTMHSRRERGVLFAEKRVLKKPKIITEAPRRIQKEKVKMKKVIRLLTLGRKLIRIKERVMLGKIKNLERPIVERKLQLRERVLNFSLAFIFWMLVSKPGNILMNEYKKSSKLDKLITKEQTPWLLLAIIWHLAMIRESRGAGSGFAGQVKQKKVKKNTYDPRFAPHGVIFAFPS